MRTPAAQRLPKPPVSQSLSFPAPTKGWIANENLAASTPLGAAVLENWFPTATGVRMRAGREVYADLTSTPVLSMFVYLNGSAEFLFASTEDAIWDITNAVAPIIFVTENEDPIVTETDDNIGIEGEPADPVIGGFTGGGWIVVQFATAGGVFLVGVNGSDDGFLFDGEYFYPLSDDPVVRLDYDTEVAGFVVGEAVTGGTSGASGDVIRVVDNGANGFLLLQSVTGAPFQNNEVITGSVAGDALANGDSFTVSAAFTGIETSDLSYVWVYKQRLWFVEKDSLNAWYLPVDQVAGAAVVFPLGGIFGRGGKLLFGATWSLDSGAAGGLSEQCVFVSTEGEVAVFQGTDPASASDWQKVGVYRVGRPLGPKSWIRGGGDIIVSTDIGFLPLSQAIQRDVAALSPVAVSYPIEVAWNERVAAVGDRPWQAEIWPTQQMSVIALPSTTDRPPEMLVANARTGAWSLYTGWEGTCLQVFKERLFFGTSDGKIMQAEVGGTDAGDLYTATCVPLFADAGTTNWKRAGMARAVLLADYPVSERLSVQSNYVLNLPTPPDATAIGEQPVWGAGVWGTSVWSAQTQKKNFQAWRSVSGEGYALSPAIQITSGDVVAPGVDLVRLEVTFQSGGLGS